MELRQIIDANFSTLLRCMDPSTELLGKLRSVVFLKDRIPSIKQQPTAIDKNDALLTALQEVPDNIQKSMIRDFTAALRSCGQEHVANIFRRESDKVPMSDEHFHVLKKESVELRKFLDPENGVLTQLFSSEVITSADKERVRSKKGFSDKAEELIDTIIRKSDDAFQALIDALNANGQSHVAYILTEQGDSQPLSKYRREKLKSMKTVLVENILPQDIVTPLVSIGVFTTYDQERVQGQVTYDEKCEMIFDLITRKSQAAFGNFIYTLQKYRHPHVVVELMGAEVAAKIEAKVSAGLPVSDTEILFDELTKNIPQALKNNEETTVKPLVEILTSNGISVSQVEKGSIIVEFRCKNYAALESLKELHSSTKLDQLFTQAFCPKFASRGLESLSVVISEEEFRRHLALKLMSSEHREALLVSEQWLRDRLIVNDELLVKLSLSERCKEAVEAEAEGGQQVKTLLDIVSRRPDSAFAQFLEALDDTQQTGAASYLRSCVGARATRGTFAKPTALVQPTSKTGESGIIAGDKGVSPEHRNRTQRTRTKQINEQQTESIDAKATISSAHMASASGPAKTDTCVQGHSSCRPKTDDSEEKVRLQKFLNELQSMDCYNFDHLTAIAQATVSLHTGLSKDQCHTLWENETFLTFIYSSAGHSPAAKHFVSLLKSNEAARMSASWDILGKFGITKDDFGGHAQSDDRDETIDRESSQLQSSNVDTQRRQNSASSSVANKSCTGHTVTTCQEPQPPWKSLIGEQSFTVTPTEHYRISEILLQPEVNETELAGFVGKVLPYILQRVQMRGCYVLQPSTLSALVRRVPVSTSRTRSDPFRAKSSTAVSAKSSQYACPVSRLDCLSCLLCAVDSIVARDLLHVMSQFPMALPLVMRNVAETGAKYFLMTPQLRGAVIKWETASAKIVEHSLFNDPFKLLVAVRLGNNSTGKSAILNQILARDDIFSRRGEPGSSYGKPVTVDGSVEFIWLTEETCKDTLWRTVVRRDDREDNAITLLANVHGDVSGNLDIINLLCQNFQCRYLAFLMPDCDETQWKAFTAQLPSRDSASFIRVDPSDYEVEDLTDIQSSRITEDETLHKVRCSIDGALKGCPVVKRVKMDGLPPRVSLINGIGTQLSQKIIDFVETNTCKSTRGRLQLQKATLCQRDVRERDTTPHVVEHFIEILESPLDERQRAVIHLESELSRLSNAETNKMRAKYLQQKKELTKMMTDQDGNLKDIVCIRRNISDSLKIIDNMNLGLEHFFRVVAHLYQQQLTANTDSTLLMLPEKVADLFLNGHPLELLDGDSEHIHMPWLNMIFKSVVEKHPKLRVYVVSIIGLQSSGKSTLLNSLFACRFAVSVGRCSNGLFMRLVFLNEKLATDWKVDAILLIDTEGLGSTEKMGDDEAEKKDRLLATFVMGISNLVIINVLGEYMKELTEIMQIAVITMTRLEKADIAPDILMIQHLLTEMNSGKLSQSEQQFCEAIRKAIDLAETKDVQVGVRDAKCLRELFARIQNETLLTQFHPYKDGATANAPASEAYHRDVVHLYEKILDCCKSSSSVIELSKWKTLLESYWDCVKQEDFSLRFKNVKEIHEFIDRGQHISYVKQAIDAAFSAHARTEKAHIVTRIQEMDDRKSLQDREVFLRDLDRRVTHLPHGCSSSNSQKCQKCREACEQEKSLYEYVQDGPYELETQETIDRYTKTVRRSTLEKLSQCFDASVMQQDHCAEFDSIIIVHLKKHIGDSKAGEFSPEKRGQITDEIMAELTKTARARDDEVSVKDKITDATLDHYRQYPDILDKLNSEFSIFEDVLYAKSQRARKTFRGLVVSFTVNQRTQEVEHLKFLTDSVLRKMLDQRQADCYEDGMVRALEQELTCQLEVFSKQVMKLSPEQKLNIHVWTLQQFLKRMEAMQDAWDKKNRPSSILNENKERYIQIINTRLEHGFTYAAEGQIIGQHLLKGIQQKAIAAENNEMTRAVESLVWTTNSEKVRLKYFKHLAEEVRDGKHDTALVHFQNPTQEIEKWYKATVDQHRSNSFGETFASTFEKEFKSVRHKVENSLKSEDIVFVAKQQNLELQSYQPSSNFEPTGDDFEIMQGEVVRTMDEGKHQFCRLDDSLFSLPSDEPSVMARLGCTERCFWCGALCWGQRGHEEDQGETRKHHSSHQPNGLVTVGYRGSDHLISRPCHEMKDDDVVYFGEPHENGVPWKEAKEKHFTEWKFDRHYIAKFDALMRWFFQELNHSIAANTPDRKPATREDLERYNCTNLSYDDILSRIEQEIN